MSRVPQTNQPIAVAPANNIYTALAAIGLLAGLIGLTVVFMRASDLGIKLLPF